MNEDARLLFHQHNAKNQINYRYNQGFDEPGANYEQYLLQFDDPDKIPLEDRPYVQKQQYKLRSDVSKYEMRQCITCFERWPTTIHVGRSMNSHQCQ